VLHAVFLCLYVFLAVSLEPRQALITTVSVTVKFVIMAREMVEAERSLEQEDLGTWGTFLLMTFGTWLVYTMIDVRVCAVSLHARNMQTVVESHMPRQP
jgi:hypothetical protein